MSIDLIQYIITIESIGLTHLVSQGFNRDIVKTFSEEQANDWKKNKSKKYVEKHFPNLIGFACVIHRLETKV